VSSVAPRSRSTDRRYYGVAEALVVDVKDPEGENRIQVKFPWFDDAMVTEWCRVAYFYAGNGYGSVFVPEVGDEVIIAFVHGDMRLPIVLGGLYNGVDKPPSARSQSVDQKLIRTKGGHELLFDDSSSEQRVRATTNGGHVVDMDDTGQSVTISSTGGHEAVLDDAGMKASVTSAGGHSVELDDTGQKVTVKTAAGQSVVLDGAGQSVTVTGLTITLDGVSISLGGAAATHPLVLGDLFMALFNAHIHTSNLPGLPTSPPVTPMLPAMLSQVTKTA
jgi:uncharacterized protein involved in type VI secretion and phage assembly